MWPDACGKIEPLVAEKDVLAQVREEQLVQQRVQTGSAVLSSQFASACYATVTQTECY